MKILITTDTFKPAVNGVATSTNNLYEELKAFGHDVRILTLSDCLEARKDGDIYFQKSFSATVYPGARVKVPFFNKAIKEIMDWKPDIIHSQTEFSTMIAAKQMAVKLKIPQIHTYHTMYEDYLNYFLKGKVLKKSTAAKLTALLLNTFDGIVAPTGKVKDALESYGIYKDIYIVPTGIDLRKFQISLSEKEKEKILKSLGIENNEKLMAYVGRIAEEKNIEEVITLFAETLKKVPDAKLLIVGGGPYLKNLRNTAKELGIEGSVYFSGMVKPEEVYKYYKIAKVFATASTSETQGLTYIEALSCGCPVLCRYDKCVEGLIVNDRNGFAYNEESEFVKYAEQMLTNNEMRDRLAKEAREKADEYSCRTFGKRIETIYETVIENRAKKAAIEEQSHEDEKIAEEEHSFYNIGALKNFHIFETIKVSSKFSDSPDDIDDLKDGNSN